MPTETPAPWTRREAGSSTPAVTIVLLYAAFGTLWILASDKLVQGLSADPAATMLAGTLKGVLFIAVTSLLLFGLLRRQSARSAAIARDPPLRRTLLPLVLIIAAVLLATAAGSVYTLKQQRGIEVARLQAIANLKTQMIADWLSAQQRGIRLLQTSPVLGEIFRRWRETGSRRDFDRVTERLEEWRIALGHSEVLLLDARGETLWSSAGIPGPAVEPEFQAAVAQSVAEGRPNRLGPYREASGRLLLDFFVPIGPGNVIQALVVLRSDPRNHLFASLQTWPVTSPSAESLLFRRDGDQVLFLNDLRHRTDTAVTFRVPLSETSVIAVQLARGKARLDRAVEGVDYRKVPSLGVVRSVPGTDWFLIAKLDQAEIYANAAPSVTWIAVSGLLALMVAGAAAAMLRQQARTMLVRQLAESQAERLRELRLLDALSESSTDEIIAKDVEGRYRLCNPAAARGLGKAPKEILGFDDTALFPAEQAAAGIARDRRVLAENRVVTVQERRTTAAGEASLLTTEGPLLDAAGHAVGLFRISRDITEFQRAEELALLWAQAFEHAGFGLALGNCEDETFIAVNAAFARERGYHPAELAGRPVLTVHPPELHEGILRHLGVLDARGHDVFESVHQCRDGRRFPVLLDVTVIRCAEGRPVQRVVYALDISERKRAEEAVRRLNQDLRTLGECNQAMVRAKDEIELLQTTCRLLIDSGGYRMAWVGYAQQDESSSVRPMAMAGEGTRYLENANITWDDRTERGQGPTGAAIREQRPVVARNLHDDPRCAVWRDAAERHGYASSIALPLLLDESHCIGALNIYAGEVDRFDADEQKLLGELASDLAYGVRTLRDRAVHRQAEEALRESEQRFRQLFNAAPVPLAYVDEDGAVVALNSRFEQTFGYGRAELPTWSEWWRLAYPDLVYRQQVRAAWNAALLEAIRRRTEIEPYDDRVTCKNGQVLTVVISASAVGNHLLAAFNDITQRKAAETKQASQLDELRRWYKVTVGREERVLELKQEVNELRQRLGEPPRYARGGPDTDAGVPPDRDVPDA